MVLWLAFDEKELIMSVLEKNINVKGYEIVKPLVKNEQHEILLARRISDDLQVVLKQSLFHDENSQKNQKRVMNTTY